MNEHFVNVKVDREERPDVDALYMDATRRDDRAGRLADDRLPDARRASRSTPARTSRRSRGTGCRASRQLLAAVAEAWRERRDDIDAQAREARRRGRQLGADRAVDRAAHRRAARRGRARRSRATFEPAYGGFGRAPKFPPASTLEFLLRRGTTEALEMVDADARRDGGGRHVRRRRRRLPPLLGRRALARAALREDALRQRAARPVVPARLGRDGRASATARSSRRRSTTCCASSLLRGGGLASAQDADTDGVEGLTYTWTPEEASGVGLDPSCCSPFEHGRSIVRGELDPELARAAARSARASGRSRSATTRRSPRGTGSRSPRSPRPRDRLERAGLARGGARGRRVPPRAALARRRAALARLARRAASAATGFLDDYANVAHGLLELHVATGEVRWLHEARRLALLAVELFADDEHGGFFLAPRGRRGARRAHEGPRRQPDPVGQLDARARAAAARRGSGATTSSSAAPSSVFRLVEPALAARRRAFGWTLCALDLWLAPPRELAIVGPSTAPSRAPRSRRSPRTRSSPSARPRTCRSSPARASSTGSRRSTSASGSPARRP